MSQDQNTESSKPRVGFRTPRYSQPHTHTSWINPFEAPTIEMDENATPSSIPPATNKKANRISVRFNDTSDMESGHQHHLNVMTIYPEEESRPTSAVSDASADSTRGFAFLKPPPRAKYGPEADGDINPRKRHSIFARGQSIYAKRQSIFAKGQSLYAKRQSLFAKGQSLYARRQSLYPNRQSIYTKRQSIYAKRHSIYAYIESASSAVSSLAHRNKPELVNVPNPKHLKQSRPKKSWYSNWSTRRIILICTVIVIIVTLSGGLAFYFVEHAKANALQISATWHPAVGTTWQIQLGGPVTNPSLRAVIYDIDLFDNNASTIANFHLNGRRVICYFSAGTYESWRPDASKFTPAMLGNNVNGSNTERWLDIRQVAVRQIMEGRIMLAQENGCDGVDPGNVDGYTFGDTSFPLTASDSANYVQYLAHAAHSSKLSIGLKNSPELIDDTIDVVDWAMNENCVQTGSCDKYQPFIQAGKPVLHVEYSTDTISQALNQACSATGTNSYSTLVKRTNLDQWSLGCPFNTLGS